MTKHQWFELIANGALVGLGAMWFIIFGLIFKIPLVVIFSFPENF